MKKLVVLTGAGISAESGLKTFRDSDGLWAGYDIEEVATPNAWKRNQKLVLDFYNYRRREVKLVNPNAAHIGLKELEQWFNVQIITQNIDNLHERAGSAQVLHLHGEIFKMRSEKNEQLVYDTEDDITPGQLAEDGAQLRPHIVWFGEAVPMIEPAAMIAATADIFVVIGTSLAVYPAAGLVEYAPDFAHKFVLDKSVPDNRYMKDFNVIEKPATLGIKDLQDALIAIK